MAQHYDATFKQLVEAHPSDWIALVGLPAGTEVAAVEAELSSITAAADKVIRVGGPAPYIAHLEFQAGPDPDLDRQLAGVLGAIADRLRREAKPEEAKELWAATHFLSGLRHELELVERLMKGVWNVDLEESVTYQAAVARGVTKGRELGRVEGRVEEARKALLLVGRRRFGEPDSAALARLERINDADHLEALIDRLLIAADWQNLLTDES